MSFLQPIWLWGLLSLILPLAIHLFSRKPPKAHPVGSLKPFVQTVSRRPRKLSLEKLLLLLLRIALLTAFFIWLAEPVWKAEPQKDKKQLVLLHPDTPKEQQRRFAENELYEVRWLHSGFPRLADSLSQKEPVDLWHLLALADGMPGIKDSIWLISPLNQGNFGPQRPALRHAVVWLPFEPQASALQDEAGYLLKLNAGLQYWEASENQATVSDTLNLVLAYAQKYEQNKQLLKWALEAAALGSPQLRLQVQEQALPAKQLPEGKLVWLSDTDAPSASWLSLKPQPAAGWILETTEGTWLTKLPSDYRQQPAELSRLPLELSRLLPELPARVQLPLTEAQASPLKIEADMAEEALLQPLEDFFLILFLMLLILERWWVYKSA